MIAFPPLSKSLFVPSIMSLCPFTLNIAHLKPLFYGIVVTLRWVDFLQLSTLLSLVSCVS